MFRVLGRLLYCHVFDGPVLKRHIFSQAACLLGCRPLAKEEWRVVGRVSIVFFLPQQTSARCLMAEPQIGHTNNTEWQEVLPTLTKWCDELEERSQGHRRAAQRLRNLNRFLGGLNVALAAVTATAMFAALNQMLQNLSLPKQILITIVAILPAISAGLQKEWQLMAREEGHVLLAQDCRILLKQMLFFIAFRPIDIRATIGSWHVRYTDVISRPAVTPHI
jgi:hypothetical protein